MLLLLDLKHGAILESPSDDVRVWRCALDPFTFLKGRVELGKVLELDKVPDVAEGSLNDGRLNDKVGHGDSGSHDVFK